MWKSLLTDLRLLDTSFYPAEMLHYKESRLCASGKPQMHTKKCTNTGNHGDFKHQHVFNYRNIEKKTGHRDNLRTAGNRWRSATRTAGKAAPYHSKERSKLISTTRVTHAKVLENNCVFILEEENE